MSPFPFVTFFVFDVDLYENQKYISAISSSPHPNNKFYMELAYAKKSSLENLPLIPQVFPLVEFHVVQGKAPSNC
jgi:hypothetical protein